MNKLEKLKAKEKKLKDQLIPIRDAIHEIEAEQNRVKREGFVGECYTDKEDNISYWYKIVDVTDYGFATIKVAYRPAKSMNQFGSEDEEFAQICLEENSWNFPTYAGKSCTKKAFNIAFDMVYVKCLERLA